MKRKLLVEVISPEEILWASEADMVVARTETGEVGILPLHAPMVNNLVISEVRVKHGDHIDYFAIEGGFLEVKEDKVVLLTPSAIPASKIETEAEKRAKEEAEKAIKESEEIAEEEMEKLRKIIERATVRMKVAGRLQKT